ncbi:Uncharacterized membrane protein [Sphingomonas gellani]|uniref:Uncharacterized membrane protein n=1 Tax=Sphingomonas gellani TaxID=1166340 RepID=A0A1H8C8K3_9SPHN|nr:TMEM175 family protein [Sphingomonas gellani]SEM91541.1 Uncharacterized membrane protein [Sphingomonas gellani]
MSALSDAQTEAHADAHPGHQLERLAFFSDAVFAIAITLLVIEIHPPHVHDPADTGAYLRALAGLWPEMFGFLISFYSIGNFWVGHHRAFSMAAHWSERLLLPNLVMLLAIVAMPFVTGFMSINGSARVPTVLYSGWLLFAALVNLWLQRRVLTPPVLSDQVAPERIGTIRRRGQAVTLGAACALIACSLAPWPGTGMAALLTIPLWRMLLDARARTAGRRRR